MPGSVKLKGTVPSLPPNGKNPKLSEGEMTRQPVKFQIILREGQEIVVGRIKVPTPAGHAFILRRFDTGAISLTTMYRACYPEIGDDWEKTETTWVKANYDTAGSNGGGKLRLAGTWIPPSLALTLAERYDLQNILPALAHAVPEPKSTYRKGGKAASSPEQTAVMNNGNTQPVKHESTVNVASALSVIPSSLPPTSPPRSAKKSGAAKPKAESPPARKRARKSASPAPSLLAKPTPSKPIRASPRHTTHTVEEEEAEVPAPDPDQDIAEAKADVAKAKAEYAARNAATPAGSKKRGAKELETPPPKLDLIRVEPGAMDMVAERPVVNPRRLANLPPTQKAAAWGGLVFMLGLGATAVLPMVMPGGSLGLW